MAIRNIAAPPRTRHNAGLGDLMFCNMVLDQYRLVRIRQGFAMMMVLKVKALASISPG